MNKNCLGSLPASPAAPRDRHGGTPGFEKRFTTNHQWLARAFCRAALAVASVFCTATPSVHAGWGNAGPGVVHVPIAAEGAVPLAGRYGEYIGVQDALDNPPPPEDLAILRMHPPFMGKSDAEITAKMHKIRAEVFDAIALIRKLDLGDYQGHHIASCLKHKLLLRQLCLEFSDRPVAGAIQGSTLNDPQESIPGTKYRCGQSAVAIRNYPCDEVSSFDATFIKMTASLLHEGLHLTQTWPNNINRYLKRDASDIQKRIDWQSNEIAASKLEEDLLSDIFTVFTFLGREGVVPADADLPDGISLSRAARSIGDEFLAATPAAERSVKANQLTSALAGRSVGVTETKRCRESVKGALAELKSAAEGGSDTAFRSATVDYSSTLRSNGWFRMQGDQVFTGVFSFDLLAGGSGENANLVRQFTPDGESTILLNQWSNITDAAVSSEGVCLGVINTASGVGGVARIDADPETGILDASSLRVLASGAGLAGGVGLALRDGSSNLVVLARDIGHCYMIDDPFGATPQFAQIDGQLPVGEIDALVFEAPLMHVISSNVPGDSFVYFLPDIDTPIDPSTSWRQVDLGPSGDSFGAAPVFYPFQVYGMAPSLHRQPVVGDQFVQIAASGRAECQVEVFDEAGAPLFSGSCATGPDGIGFATLDQPLPMGCRVQVCDSSGRHSARLSAVDNGDFLMHTEILPIVPDVAGGRNASLIFTGGRPNEDVEIFQSTGLNFPSQPFARGTTDGFGEFAMVFPSEAPRAFFSAQHGPRSFAVIDNPSLPVITAGNSATGNFLSLLHGDPGVFYENGWSFEVTEFPVQLTGTAESLELFQVGPRGNYNIVGINPFGNSFYDCSVQVIDELGQVVIPPFSVSVPIEQQFLPQIVATAGGYEVPCLVIGGERFPKFQFRLVSGHGLNVPEPHWHWYPSYGCSSLENPQIPIPDPQETVAGFGRRCDIEEVTVIVSVSDYRNFAAIWNSRIGD